MTDARTKTMATLYRDGHTLHEIGVIYGITRERVRQILTFSFGITAKDGGQFVVAARRKQAKQAAADARSIQKYGCCRSQYLELRRVGATRRWHQQRMNAMQRGIGWSLSLWQWWVIWQQSGHWEHRGCGQGYVMCRKGDVGPYSADNVFIELATVNSSKTRWKKSGLPIGVSFRRGRFIAGRNLGGKHCYLGSFSSAEQAHAAYLAAGQQINERRVA